MVKKIVVLAISLVLAIGSIVSYNVVNDKAVEFGAGKGVSRTIKNVSELSEVMAKIPSFEMYSENDNVSEVEGNEEFKGVTVIETGYVSQYSNYRLNVRLPDAEPEDEDRYYTRDQQVKNHKLVMNFAPNAVYYHSIGTMWNATEYYNYEEPSEGASFSFNFYNDQFEVAYRTKTDYDVEIYHAKDKSMFKINSYVTTEQRATDYSYEKNGFVYSNYTPETDEEDADSDEEFMNTLIDKMLKIREDSFGSWIEYPKTEDPEEGEEPEVPEDPYAGLEGLDPESQEYQDAMMQIMIDMMVQEFTAELTNLAYQDFLTVQQAHASNKNYLNNLASYITANSSNGDYFKKTGNVYKLQEGKYVPAVTDPETNDVIEEGYFDYSVPDSYLEQVANMTPLHGNNTSCSVKFDFMVDSDLISINQDVTTSTNYSSNKIDTNTVIMNVDNTIVNLSKNAKIKSLDQAYVQPFNKIMTEMADQIRAQLGGNE